MILKALTSKDLAEKSKDNIPDPQLLPLRLRLGRGLGDHSFGRRGKQEAGKEKRWVEEKPASVHSSGTGIFTFQLRFQLPPQRPTPPTAWATFVFFSEPWGTPAGLGV